MYKNGLNYYKVHILLLSMFNWKVLDKVAFYFNFSTLYRPKSHYCSLTVLKRMNFIQNLYDINWNRGKNWIKCINLFGFLDVSCCFWIEIFKYKHHLNKNYCKWPYKNFIIIVASYYILNKEYVMHNYNLHVM